MQRKEVHDIETHLGKWDFNIPLATYALEARFEKSDTQIGYHIPHPDRNITILARPYGVQITSQDGIKIRRDFMLHYSAIKAVQVLPSYTVDTKRSISIINIIAFATLAYVMGVISKSNQIFSLTYILLGAILGSIFSLAETKQSKRPNLLITYQEGNAEHHVLLSIGKRERVFATNFFLKFCPDKFVQ